MIDINKLGNRATIAPFIGDPSFSIEFLMRDIITRKKAISPTGRIITLIAVLMGQRFEHNQ